MTNRLKIFWGNIQALWKMMPPTARFLLIIFALAAPLAVLILSSERDFWLLLCGGLGLVGVWAAWVIYRLVLRGPK